MKIVRFFIALAVTVAFIWSLQSYQATVGGAQVPPLGKFLNPFTGFWQNAEPISFQPEELLTVEGLQGEVKVVIDTIGFPHVFAANDHDLYFTQGYITARDRLWQMELQTHFAAGRISEIVGSRALELDRLNRRKGLAWAAERSLAALQQDPEALAITEAYADGVNAYIRSLSQGQLPIEYKLLNYEPEPWTPYKSLLLLKYMANDLNFSNSDFPQQNVRAVFGEGLFDLLFPITHPEQRPIVNRPGQWDFEPLPVMPPSEGPETVGTVKWKVENPPENLGSNNWAVSGKKTAEGHPILCGDPHLSLNLPSIWYGMQLQAPGINCMGATLPGAPSIIIGFNDSVAWSVTNARRDLVDWYELTFEDESWEAYQLDDSWVPTQKRIEEIVIMGGDTFYDTVTYTHWGPVMYDRSFRGGSQPDDRFFALKWITHEPSMELMTFHHLNRANNYEDYRGALKGYGSPAQNFAFAAANGDIAMAIQGKFPLRWQEQGRFPLKGNLSENDWQGFIPAEHNAFEYNPESGYVSSANQFPVDSTYPYYVYANSYEMYRGRRIKNLLDSMEQITPRDMMLIQNDNYSIKAEESLPFLLSQLEGQELTPKETEMLQKLREWDLFYSANSEAAACFDGWTDRLRRLLWDEMRNADLPMLYPSAFTTLKLLQNHPELMFVDVQETAEKETVSDLVFSTFRETVKALDEFKDRNGTAAWARVKGTSIRHLLNLPAFGVPYVGNGGNGDALNANRSRSGPSWRFVVELAPEGPQAWAAYPGGQSGNPGSPFYDNLVERWGKGEYFALPFMKNWDEQAAGAVLGVQRIVPASP